MVLWKFVSYWCSLVINIIRPNKHNLFEPNFVNSWNIEMMIFNLHKSLSWFSGLIWNYEKKHLSWITSYCNSNFKMHIDLLNHSPTNQNYLIMWKCHKKSCCQIQNRISWTKQMKNVLGFQKKPPRY